MLYDEEGKVYVERPVIPQEHHLFYIVKDYRRMYVENMQLRNQITQLKRKNCELKKRNLRQGVELTKAYDALNHCVKHMKKCGVALSTFLEKFIKEHKSLNQKIRYGELEV